jgi:hypothetical protein
MPASRSFRPLLSIALFFLLAVATVSSINCPFSEGISAVGSVYDLVDTKISIVGFEASVKYTSLPAGKTGLDCKHAMPYFV